MDYEQETERLEPEAEDLEPETAKDFEEAPKEAKLRRWLPRMGSCVYGSVIALGLAGLMVNPWPPSSQVVMFFVLFFGLALLFSFVAHWVIYLRPNQLMKKLKDEEEKRDPPDPIHPE